MLPGINYGQFINANMPQNGYQINTPVQTPVKTHIPQIQKPQVGGQTDVLEINRQQQFQPQTQQKPELGLVDEALKRLGIFQDKLVQTAMKNNPQILALCAQHGINGKVEAKNLDDVSNHARATSKYAVKIGEYMGFGEEDLGTLGTAAKFHDIGKALIPREVFAKPGKFDEDERKVMALHSDFSAEILKGLNFDKEVIAVAEGHHDGYNMFSTSKTDKMVQIVKVADIYSALSESRAYKKAMSNDEVFAIMDNMAQSGEISPEALSALKQGISDERPTFEVRPNATNPFATATAVA